MITRRTLMAFTASAAMFLSGHAMSQEKKELVIAYPSSMGLGYFALYNAIGEGYFEEENITIRPESLNGSAQVIQALLAGQAQLGHPGPGPLLNARGRGEDLIYIYNYFARSQFNLVTTEDSPFQTPADLRGKVIGVGTSDGAEVAFVRSIFDAAGMKEGSDYTFITVGEGGMAVAGFANKSIDAYAADTAGTATLRLRGVKLRNLTPPDFKAYFGNGYVTTRSFLDDNKDVLEGFGRALVRGVKFGIDPANREATLQHAQMGNPQQLEDKEFASALLDIYFDLTTPLDPTKGYGYQNPVAWQQWQSTLVAAGDLKQPLDNLEQAYTNEFIEKWNAPR